MYLRPRIAFLVVTLIAIAVACGPRMEKATLERIDDADAKWHSNPVSSYHIVVDVKRSDELRRQDIDVRDGQIERGSVQYWNSRSDRWENTIILNDSQSIAFTVPGLLETVREEIKSGRRPIIQVAMIQNPPYFQRIVLGQVWQNDQAVPNSQASLVIQKFEKR